MKLPRIIYVMGMPGAGKGTQAQMIAEAIGYKQFSTGNAFRAISRQNTDLGRRVKAMIDNGYLSPPEMAAEVVIHAVDEYIAKGFGLVFDGTPRTRLEGEIIDAYFEKRGYELPLVIYLSVDKDTMVERNSKRRFCLGINGDFPVITPADEQRCNELNGQVGTRPDDERTKFVTRYDQFMTLTYPAIEKYQKNKELFFEVDGMPDPNEVHKQIMEVIRQFELPKKV